MKTTKTTTCHPQEKWTDMLLPTETNVIDSSLEIGLTDDYNGLVFNLRIFF